MLSINNLWCRICVFAVVVCSCMFGGISSSAIGGNDFSVEIRENGEYRYDVAIIRNGSTREYDKRYAQSVEEMLRVYFPNQIEIANVIFFRAGGVAPVFDYFGGEISFPRFDVIDDGNRVIVNIFRSCALVQNDYEYCRIAYQKYLEELTSENDQRYLEIFFCGAKEDEADLDDIEYQCKPLTRREVIAKINGRG